MACMEHFCLDCGHTEFNNRVSLTCAKCKSENISSHYDDEPLEDEDEDQDDEHDEHEEDEEE